MASGDPQSTCPRCGKDNPAGAKFCLECGAALRQAIRPIEERKIVSVLFADLVGFTSQAERMDPEEVRAILQPYHASVRADLQRWGGTVEKFIGDAVMALFGAPVAREDDPERAVRSALAIRETLAADGRLHVRIGITTGEALVTLDARPETGEGMAAGDVVNTAARLQAAAAVDGILVDETTFRATARAIEYRDHEPVSLKGKAEPVHVHEVVAARARFGVDVRQIGRAPLVGRVRELELLVGAGDRARNEREPQLVTLVGVPGIGKSRLVWELFQQIEAGTEIVAWRQGRSLPYAEGISFWALGEILKAEAGILETDTSEDAAEKVSRAVGSLALEEVDAQWIERHLRPLVGLEAGTELRGDRRGEAFAAWTRFIEALADKRPLVLVFEDLHWADEGLLDFLDHLVDRASGVPLLIICTSRPEILSRRPGWGGGKPNALTISLSPLSEAEAARLVASLVERAVIPARVRSEVLERAQGNPLYAEEFARLLSEGGGIEDLPDSVQGIIAARLDALSREEKSILQDAAVMGKVFWSGALAGMRGIDRMEVEELLHGLARKEFVRRERRSSVARETEYAFRHIVVRDVAYSQIPRAERGERHALAAGWIEALGRLADHAELLAQHYLSAIELAQAAGRPNRPSRGRRPGIDPQRLRCRSALLPRGARVDDARRSGSTGRPVRVRQGATDFPGDWRRSAVGGGDRAAGSR
jgi:class 3 adenylate cyclase